MPKRWFYSVLGKNLRTWPQSTAGLGVKAKGILGQGKGFIVNASRSAPTKSAGSLTLNELNRIAALSNEVCVR